MASDACHVESYLNGDETMNAKTKKTETAQQTAGNGSNEPRVLEDESKRNIRPLGKDEKPNASMTVQGSGWETARVEAHFEVGNTAAIKKPHQAVSILDFSDCSREEILRLASKPVVIALQRRWNVLAGSDLAKATAPGMFAQVNVKRDVVDAARQSAPPSAKADKLVDKMSADEKRALLAKLEAELNGGAAA